MKIEPILLAAIDYSCQEVQGFGSILLRVLADRGKVAIGQNLKIRHAQVQASSGAQDAIPLAKNT